MSLQEKSALELSAMIEAGQVSCVEVMRSALDRIAEVNGAMNAIVSLRDESALMAEARAFDGAERKGWLHGIPIAIKDLANASRYPSTTLKNVVPSSAKRRVSVRELIARALATSSCEVCPLAISRSTATTIGVLTAFFWASAVSQHSRRV